MSVKNIYDVLCKRMKREFYIAIALLGTFLFVSCQKDELSGKMYRGYYDPLQHMLIVFKDNSKVKAHMSSAEVLGFFSDDVYGHYVYRPPYIDIVWEKHARGNRVYNMYSPLPVPDSLRVNESMTELIWFEDEKEYHLKEDTLYHINKEDPFYKQALDYLKESLFYVFLFIISHFIPICIIILVFIIVLGRIKAWKRQK